MPQPEPTGLFNDRQRDQLIHHIDRGEYELAASLVSKELRAQTLVAAIQDGTGVFVDQLLRDDPDFYRAGIRDALLKASREGDQEALEFLVFHPQNIQMVQRESEIDILRAQREQQRVAHRQQRPKKLKPEIPTFISIRHTDFSPFTPQEEEKAKAVLRGEGPFRSWKEQEDIATVPSFHGFEIFAEAWLLRRQARAKYLLKEEKPLDAELSNVHYHPQASYEDSLVQVQEKLEKRGFSHLAEQVIRKMLEELGGRLGIQAVLHASPEEDIYETVDLFVQTEGGDWIGVDVTLAQEKGRPKKRIIQPKNLFTFLCDTGKFRQSDWEHFGIPLWVFYFPREIYREIVNQVIEEFEKKQDVSVSAIVEKVYRKYGKGLQETLGLFSQAFSPRGIPSGSQHISL